MNAIEHLKLFLCFLIGLVIYALTVGQYSVVEYAAAVYWFAISQVAQWIWWKGTK